MSASHPVRVVASLVLALAALWAPASAGASCVVVDGQEAWLSADAVFVGTVRGIDNNARWAEVTVEEIWRGPDLPVDVVVRGGPADPGTATSVDRTYLPGVRYLFAVMVVDGNLEDNACSGTTAVEGIDVDAMRPADVRPPSGGSFGTGPTDPAGGLDVAALAGPVLVVAAIGGALLVTVLLARRRES